MTESLQEEPSGFFEHFKPASRQERRKATRWSGVKLSILLDDDPWLG
jgi:hypothetical protein